MSTAKLIIRNKSLNRKGQCLIFIQYHHKGKTTLLSTKEKIEPKHWNSKDEQVKKSNSSYQDINSVIYKEKERLEHLVREAKFNDIEVDVNYVLSKFREKEAVKNEKKQYSTNVIELFNQFIQQSERFKKASTIQNYKGVKNHLVRYEEMKKMKLSVIHLDYKFYEDFTSYLIDTHQQSNNTIGKTVKIIKVFISHLEKLGIEVPKSSKDFKVQEQETTLSYVTKEELISIMALDLKEEKELEEVRDRFCFGCFTGLRFSDQELKNGTIKNNEIHIKTVKTNDNLIIPLNEYSKELISKYKKETTYQFTSISNHKYNELLQEIGKRSGLNEEITKIHYSGSR